MVPPIVRLIMKITEYVVNIREQLPVEIARIILGFIPVRRRLTVRRPYFEMELGRAIAMRAFYHGRRRGGGAGGSWGYLQ